MKKSTIVVILVASIAFNLAFIGMFVVFNFFGPKHPEFNMKPEIPDSVSKRFFEETRIEMRAHAEKLRNKKRMFFKELSSTNYDEEQLKEIAGEIVANQIEMEKYLAERLIKARKEMSAQEAKSFFKQFEMHERGQRQEFKGRIGKDKRPPFEEHHKKF